VHAWQCRGIIWFVLTSIEYHTLAGNIHGYITSDGSTSGGQPFGAFDGIIGSNNQWRKSSNKGWVQLNLHYDIIVHSIEFFNNHSGTINGHTDGAQFWTGDPNAPGVVPLGNKFNGKNENYARTVIPVGGIRTNTIRLNVTSTHEFVSNLNTIGASEIIIHATKAPPPPTGIPFATVSGNFTGNTGFDDVAYFAANGNRVGIQVYSSNGTVFVYKGVWWDSGPGGLDTNAIVGVVAGNFSGHTDGKKDIAAIFDNDSDQHTYILMWRNNGSSFVFEYIWWNSGIGGYAASAIVGVVAGNFSGHVNGREDIAAVFENDLLHTYIHVWTTTGSAFTYQGAWWNSGAGGYTASAVVGVVAGDFTGNGRDAIATIFDNGYQQTYIHVWLSTSSSFVTWWNSGVNGYDAGAVVGVVAGNFSGHTDGKKDIAAIFDNDNQQTYIHVWSSTGSGFVYQNYWWNSGVGQYDAKGINSFVFGNFGESSVSDLATVFDDGEYLHTWLCQDNGFAYQGNWK